MGGGREAEAECARLRSALQQQHIDAQARQKQWLELQETDIQTLRATNCQLHQEAIRKDDQLESMLKEASPLVIVDRLQY